MCACMARARRRARRIRRGACPRARGPRMHTSQLNEKRVRAGAVRVRSTDYCAREWKLQSNNKPLGVATGISSWLNYAVLGRS